MSWFSDKFLPSLFERAGTGGGMWLTVRQTEICIQNMDGHRATWEEYGSTYSRQYFTTTWNGREVHLSYSKRNCCGQITFGPTADEQRESAERAQKERDRMDIAAKCLTLTIHPDRFHSELEQLQKEYASLDELDREDKEDGIFNKEVSDNRRNRCIREIGLYESALKLHQKHGQIGKREAIAILERMEASGETL